MVNGADAVARLDNWFAGATGSACASLRPAPWILASMLALRSQVMEAAGARSGVEQPGQSIAGNSARRASCAARRQLERGRAGERRAHRRLAGQAGLLRRLAGHEPDCFVTLVSHRHRRVLLCPPPRRTYGGPGTLRLRCVVCVMAALATRSSSSTAASSSSTATSQQQQQSEAAAATTAVLYAVESLSPSATLSNHRAYT